MGLDAGFNCYSSFSIRKRLRERLIGEYYFREDHVLNDAVLMASEKLHGPAFADIPSKLRESCSTCLKRNSSK
jgi:hypothetical protein